MRSTPLSVENPQGVPPHRSCELIYSEALDLTFVGSRGTPCGYLTLLLARYAGGGGRMFGRRTTPPPEVRGTSRGHDHCVAASLGVANPAPGPAELTAALELAILDSAWSPRAVLVKNLLRGHLWAFGPFANPVEAIEYAERIPSDIFGPTGGNIEVLVLPLELP